MDDDLDFSNDGLLRQIQEYQEQIEKQLEECRTNLQKTVDQISWIENKREIEHETIEKEFEKIQYEIQYILDKRKKQVLHNLDEEINAKRTSLLNRAQSYQSMIIEAAELQSPILSLENYEKTIHSNIIKPNMLTKEKGYSQLNSTKNNQNNIYGSNNENDKNNNNDNNLNTNTNKEFHKIDNNIKSTDDIKSNNNKSRLSFANTLGFLGVSIPANLLSSSSPTPPNQSNTTPTTNNNNNSITNKKKSTSPLPPPLPPPRIPKTIRVSTNNNDKTKSKSRSKSNSLPLPSPSPQSPNTKLTQVSEKSQTPKSKSTTPIGYDLENPLNPNSKLKGSIITTNSIINDNNKNNYENNNNNNEKISKTENDGWTKLGKRRLILEVQRFLGDKPIAANSPSVQFSFNRNKFIKDIEFRINKFGYIYSSTGSSMEDFTNTVSDSLGWLQNNFNNLQKSQIGKVGSFIANSFKKKHELKELKEIAPPLLIVYLGIEKALAETFVEFFLASVENSNVVDIPSGVVIPIIDYNDIKRVQKWLDPRTMGGSKLSIKKKSKSKSKSLSKSISPKPMSGNSDYVSLSGLSNGMSNNPINSNVNDIKNKDDNDNNKDGKIVDSSSESDDDDERDYAYEHPDTHDDNADFRPVLRVIILLYNAQQHDSQDIDLKVNSWVEKYNIRAISSVEMKRVTNEQPTAYDCPNCYVGCIFYDEDGIVEGQDTIFDGVAQSVFTPNQTISANLTLLE